MLRLKTMLVAPKLHHNNNVKMESQVCTSLLGSQIWFWNFSWPYCLENCRMVGFYAILIFKMFLSLDIFFFWWRGQISPPLCKSGRLWVSDFWGHQGNPGLKCFGADTMQVVPACNPQCCMCNLCFLPCTSKHVQNSRQKHLFTQ